MEQQASFPPLYNNESFHIELPAIKDMLQDIVIEGFGHLEMVGKLIEIHTQMFMKALDSLDKLTDPFFGNIQPDETVKLYYNLSTDGSGKDERGSWSSESDFEYIFLILEHDIHHRHGILSEVTRLTRI